MFEKFRRLFIIKTRFEAFAIIFALATGGVERGQHYIADYPGWGGKVLFLATTGAVFMAGAAILDYVKMRQAREAAALAESEAAQA